MSGIFPDARLSGFHIDKARLPQWDTYGEAIAFRDLMEKEKPRRVIVVSTDVHLRRIALAQATLCRDVPYECFTVRCWLAWRRSAGTTCA